MFLRKFLVIVVSILLFGQSVVFTQNKPEVSVPKAGGEDVSNDVSPEVKEKAFGLLQQSIIESQQLQIPSNRIYFQVTAADLLWQKDEKQARGLYLAAQNELRSVMDQTEVKLSQDENTAVVSEDEDLIANEDAKPLRELLILSLAEHDPKAALDALQALKRSAAYKPKDQYGYDPLGDEDQLELKISVAIVKKDPNRAFEVARRNLEKGFPQNLLETLSEIYKKDSELGAKLAREILSKLKVSKIQNEYEAANVATNMAIPASNVATSSTPQVSISPEISVWQISQFLKTTAASLQTAQKANKPNSPKKVVPLLSESDVSELANLIAQNFTSRRQIYSYEVGSVMPELTKYAPSQAQIIKRKLGAEGVKQAEEIARSFNDVEEFNNKTADEIALNADKLPPEQRDARLGDAVRKALSDEQPEKAKKYYDQIKEKDNYKYLSDEIETQLPLAKAKQGNIEEVRKLIDTRKSSNDKVSVLCALAKALATRKNMSKEEKNAAMQLIGEARQYLPPRSKKSAQLSSIVEVIRASAFVETSQGFDLLENTMPAINDLIAAAIIVDDFNQYGATRQDELTFDTMQRQSLRGFPQAVEVLRKFAESDFDRTAAIADKFSRNDVRAFVRLQIAQALLDPKAIEKESEAAKTAGNEGEGDI